MQALKGINMIKPSNNNENSIKRIAVGLLLVVSYFVLEPLLSHVYVLYALSLVNRPYMVLKAVLPWLVFALLVYRIIREKGKINYGDLLPIAVLLFGYLFGTINGKADFRVWFETAISVLALCVFIMPISRNEDTVKLFVTAVTDLYIFLALVNLAFKIWPELYLAIGAWEEESFLGSNENMCSFPLLMGVFFALADAHLNGKKIKAGIYLAVYFVSTYLMWTAAAVLCAMLLIIWLIPPVRRFFDKLDMLWLVGASALLFVILMWCWEPIMNWAPIRFLTEDILRKDVTLTGRVGIWKGVLQMVYEKPLLGHGLLDDPHMYQDFGYNAGLYTHAHSAYLQTLYEGGFLTILAVFALLVFTSVKIRKSSDKNFAGIFKIIIFLFLLNLQVDQFLMYPWRSGCWCMICFLCNFAVMVSENER